MLITKNIERRKKTSVTTENRSILVKDLEEYNEGNLTSEVLKHRQVR